MSDTVDPDNPADATPASKVSKEQLLDWISTLRDRVTEQRAYLTDLDSAIGDADHGSNLTRGFSAAMDKLDSAPPDTPGPLLKAVGMALVSKVGGASGPLYGTFFLELGKSVGAMGELDATALGEALDRAVDGVTRRGKAEPGDKTMLDALVPASRAFNESAGAGATPSQAARAAADAAAKGRDDTESLVARKGRASYLGERSAGHIDPGAASSAIMLAALADVLDR